MERSFFLQELGCSQHIVNILRFDQIVRCCWLFDLIANVPETSIPDTVFGQETMLKAGKRTRGDPRSEGDPPEPGNEGKARTEGISCDGGVVSGGVAMG